MIRRAAFIAGSTGVLGMIDAQAYARHAAPHDLLLPIGYAAFLAGILVPALGTPGSRSFTLLFVVAAISQLASAAILEGPVLVALLSAAVWAVLIRIAPALRRPALVAAYALSWPVIILVGGDAPLVRPGPALALVWLISSATAVLAATRGARSASTVAALAGAATSALAGRHLSVGSAGAAPDEVLVGLLVAAVCAMVALRRRTSRGLVVALGLLTPLVVGAVLVLTTPIYTDSAVAQDEAARIALAGGNPYRELDLVAALAERGMGLERATRLDEEHVRRFPYPAGAIAVAVPSRAAGIGDVRWTFLASLLLLGSLCVWVRPAARPLALAAFVGATPLLREAAVAGNDPTWALLLSLALASQRRTFVSAVVLGCAMTMRQLAWVYAPFAVMRAARVQGAAAAWQVTIVSAATFVAIDAPFILRDPRAWWEGITTSLLGGLPPYGVGLVRLVEIGLTPPDRLVFAAFSAGVFGAAMLATIRWGRDHPTLATALPPFALFVAWRSLSSYFAPAGLIALADRERARSARGRRLPR